jgi:hypothetical protein
MRHWAPIRWRCRPLDPAPKKYDHQYEQRIWATKLSLSKTYAHLIWATNLINQYEKPINLNNKYE